MLAQGFEMLFVPAFAFGRHSAARLVHCAFLLATVPLILRIGRRLELPEGVVLAAAVLYFCAPMTGITGTSAYTDAGGVFFTLATFYVLLVWRDTRDVALPGTGGHHGGVLLRHQVSGRPGGYSGGGVRGGVRARHTRPPVGAADGYGAGGGGAVDPAGRHPDRQSGCAAAA